MELNRKIDVSATWEIELLISGLVLVALLQLPGALDHFFEPRIPHAIGGTRAALIGLQLYTKAMAFALIGCFLLHLIGRAYWVGLIGLNSVFPKGPNWEQMRYGPLARAIYQRRFTSLPTLIARTDDFCSITFPFAFLLIVLVAMSVVYGAVFGGITYLMVKYVTGPDSGRAVFSTVVLLFALTPVVLTLVDRRYGARLDPDRGLGRAIGGTLATFTTLSGIGVAGPLMFTLFSNIRKKIIYPLFYFAFLGILLASFASMMIRRRAIVVNSYDYFASAQALGVDASHYESLRSEDEEFRFVPTIQSDIVTEPYVRLFIPINPRRANATLAAACPGLRPLAPRGLRFDPSPVPDSIAAPVLQCLARNYAVAVNGTPQPGLELRFHEHARSGMRGVLAYIPTAGLPAGRNEIVVRRLRAEGSRGDPGMDRISFWK